MAQYKELLETFRENERLLKESNDSNEKEFYRSREKGIRDAISLYLEGYYESITDAFNVAEENGEPLEPELVARSMLLEEFNDNFIVECTGIEIDELNNLKMKINNYPFNKEI